MVPRPEATPQRGGDPPPTHLKCARARRCASQLRECVGSAEDTSLPMPGLVLRGRLLSPPPWGPKATGRSFTRAQRSAIAGHGGRKVHEQPCRGPTALPNG